MWELRIGAGMEGIFRKIVRMLLVFTVIIGLAGTATACSPKYASLDQIKKYISENTDGESVEYVKKLEKHRYLFKSKKRNMEFEAWTGASELFVDGTNLGYTGDYFIATNYEEKTHTYYNKKIKELLAKYEFENCVYSDDFKCYKKFKFCLTYNSTAEDIERVNNFLNELQTIVDDEDKLHDGDYSAGFFNYEVVWDHINYFERTTGNSNYSQDMNPGDESHDILTLNRTEMYLSNIIAPVYDGVLIYVN